MPTLTEKQMADTLKKYLRLRKEIADETEALSKKLKPFYDAHQLKVAKRCERMNALRNTILTQTWPKPKEGTESFVYKTVTIKCVTKVQRIVDKALIKSAEMLKRFRAMGIPMDEVIRSTPELDLKAYRKLTPTQRKHFDQILIIKDPVQTLEIEGTL